MWCVLFHTPSNLVVAYWTSDVKSTASLDFLWRHDLWTPFGCPMSCKIRSIISAACDFTTKSGGRPPRPEGRGFHAPGWLRCGPCGATPFPPRPERRGSSGVLDGKVLCC